MATHHGKNGTVKSGSNTVAEVTDFTINESAATVDDSSMGDTSETHLVGLKSWTANVKAHWDENDAGQITFTIGSSVTVSLYPEGAGAGAAYATGTATITSRGVDTSLNGVVGATFDLKGNGPLTWTTL